MKQSVVANLVLTTLIFVYGVYFQILPLLGQIQSLTMQSQALQLQVHSMQRLSQKGLQLSSRQFYTWLNAAHLSGLTLIDLAETKQGMHLVLLAKPDVLKTFLELVQDSQFRYLQLSELNGHEIKIDGVFSILSLATPLQKQVLQDVPVAKKSITVGVVHQYGRQFCVVQAKNGVKLLRKKKC